MENFIYIIFMIIIIIISSAIKSFFKKAAKQKYNNSSNFENQEQINVKNEEDTEKNESSILEQLFNDFTIKKESQVYNKAATLKNESISPLDIEIKKYKEPKVDKKIIEEGIKIEPEVKKPEKYSEKKFEENIIDKESSLDRIKKLSYLEQAIVLSEILGKPKGFDI